MQLLQQYLPMPAHVWPLLTFSESTICVLVRHHLVYAHHITIVRAMCYKVLGIRRIEAIQHLARESAKNGKVIFFGQMAGSKSVLEKKPYSPCIQNTPKSPTPSLDMLHTICKHVCMLNT